MNKGLTRLHRVLAGVYFFIWLAFVLFALFKEGPPHGAVIVAITVALGLPFALHALAARGAADGQPSGRNLSRVIGVLMLFGFPIGTVIGVFILIKTSAAEWQQAAAEPPKPESRPIEPGRVL